MIEGEKSTAPANISRTNAIILGSIASVICLIAGIAIGAVAFSSDGGSTSSASSSSRVSLPTSVETPEPDFIELPPATDFGVSLVVTEQKCFGSAGCNYTLSVTPQYLGVTQLSDDLRAQVIFEIVGGDDPQMASINIENGQFRFDQETTIQGPQSASFAANVTQVIRAY